MTLSASDISFVLSGGTSNTDPLLSLGGDPSSAAVSSGLFDDLDESDTTDGSTDYRCIYIANDSGVDTLYEAAFYTEEAVDGGVPVTLGFLFQDDVQQVSITTGTSVSSGSFVMSYEGEEFTVDYASPVSAWAEDFQDAVREVTGLEDVTVAGGTSGTTVVFTVTFTGSAGNRYHEAMEVVDDSGLSIGAGNVVVTKILDGAPVNSIAPEIDVPTTPPANIFFDSYSSTSKADVGELRPADIVPVWIKRTCPADQEAVEGDGFSLKLSGSPFAP